MADEPIVVKISLKFGDEKAFVVKQTILPSYVKQVGMEKAKAAAIEYFGRMWDKWQEKKTAVKLRLIKDKIDG